MVTYTYHPAKVIANYLRPLCQNEFTLDDTQWFSSMWKQQTPFSLDEEYVWYNVESLFANIPIDETILYIFIEMYQKVCHKLQQISIKIIFKGLLYKLTKEVSFQFHYNLLKQINGCTKGDSLFVTLADIDMIRMETDVVVPISPIF